MSDSLWPMDCSTPGFPVLHYLPELTQTHVHCVGDAIQPSHLLSYPSPPSLDLSRHQGIFQWISSSHQMAKLWSFSFSISPSNEYSGLISFRIDWFDPCYARDSQESSPAPQFESISSSVLSLLYGPSLTSTCDYWKTIALNIQTFISNAKMPALVTYIWHHTGNPNNCNMMIKLKS